VKRVELVVVLTKLADQLAESDPDAGLLSEHVAKLTRDNANLLSLAPGSDELIMLAEAR